MRWTIVLRLVLFLFASGSSVLGAEKGGEDACVPSEICSSTGPQTATQNQIRGTIHGSILSTSGARLEGATVTLTETATGAIQRVPSGAMGMFRATGLKAGVYDVKVDLPGFKSLSIPDLMLKSTSPRSLNITLEQAFTIDDQITVIGTAPASSLEFAEIRESSARDLGEALTKKTGVWRIRKGGIANDVVLRGFQGRDLNVLIDGQRVYGACPNNMDPVSFHADFAEVDRVDIAKGPFDIKNEGGLGGSINIVTQRPPRNWHTRANLAAGSYGFINPSATISYGGDDISALGGFSYRRSDPYTDGSGRSFTELTNYKPEATNASAFDIGTFWGKVGFSPTATHQLQLSYAHQNAENVLYPYLRMDAEFDNTDRFGFRWEAEQLNDTLTGLLVHTYYTEVGHWMTDELRTSSEGTTRGYSMGTMADTRTFGSKVETRLHDWTLGFEGYRRFWGVYTEMAGMNYKTQFSLPDVRMTSFGFYGECLRPLSEKLILTAGARMDRISSNADPNKANTSLYQAYHDTAVVSAVNISPSGFARLDYSPKTALNFGIGLGTAVQVPEPHERFFALKRKKSDWVGSPLLRPSRNTGIDGIFSVDRAGTFIEASLFMNWVGNFVILYDQPRLNEVPGVINSKARTYANTDARLWGTEFNLVFPLEDRVFLSGDLSYIRGTKTPITELGILSPNLAEIPPLRARVNLRCDQGLFFAAVEGVYSAAQNHIDLDLSEEETSSYAIMNLNGGIRRGRFSFTVGIGNLFNRNFSEHLSFQRDPFRSGVRITEPGRNLFINLGIDL